MKTWLRSVNNKIKSDYMPGGSKAKWFPIYDAIENFIFSSTKKTANPIHVRDAIDIQRIMVTVWLAAFPRLTAPPAAPASLSRRRAGSARTRRRNTFPSSQQGRGW